MNSWAQNLISFYLNLSPDDSLPGNVKWLYPQADPVVRKITEEFFNRFYNDSNKRTILLGINPGRFGAGVTGINFTAQKQLLNDCLIPNSFKAQSELSAEFIYEMINAYGGPSKFYYDYFIGSVSPLGFVKDGKNINYYDDKKLLQHVEPFIISNLEKLYSFNVNKDKCFSIGGEKNFKYLTALNERKKWFKEIVPLPHPRFIMQYKRKFKNEYIQQYLHFLSKK